MAKQILALIRAGANSIHRTWTPKAARHIDIAISSFGDAQAVCEEATFTHHFDGGKMEGVHAFFREFGSKLDAYRYFWLLDDDIFLPLSSILLIDRILAHVPITLAQPALTAYSYVSHPLLVENKAFVMRVTDFVEIMAPIVSRDLLPDVLPTLLENKSGWGIEWLWQRSLAQRREASVVFDAAPMVHTRPIGGPTYKGSSLATADQEYNDLARRHRLDPSRPMHNLCGFSRHGDDVHFETGPGFLKTILEGYAYTLDEDPQVFERCMNTAMKQTPIDEEARAKFRDAEPIRHILADVLRGPLQRHAAQEAMAACG